MQLAPLAVAAAAAALIIIPEPSQADESTFKALPVLDGSSAQPIQAESHLISVPCAQCDGADAKLQLNFSIVDDFKLLLNGFELYPHANPWRGHLAAPVASVDRETSRQRLGYSLAVVRQTMGKDASLQLLDVELRVIEVGDRFVNGVPVVNVKLFKAPSEEIIIANVDTTPSVVSACSSIACHARVVVADAFRAFKGIRPYRNCHRRPHVGHDKTPHSDGHPWGRLLTDIAAQILLPVLMGITAGVGVALLAMTACSLISRITNLVRGKRADGYISASRSATSESAIASEKMGLMEKSELPPQYDAPE